MEVAEREEQFVAFSLAGEVYGVDISLVREILRMQEITWVPRTSPDVEGVINLRGQIVPIVNLRRRLGLPDAERRPADRIVVVDMDFCTAGMIVDGMVGVRKVPSSCIEPPSPLIGAGENDTIRAIARVDAHLFILLDIRKVLRLEA